LKRQFKKETKALKKAHKEAKKACKNSMLLGTGADNQASAAVQPSSANATVAKAFESSVSNVLKIETLRDCMHAVRDQLAKCSGHFQLHKDTLQCSCVPAGATCAETDDENICRYQMVEE